MASSQDELKAIREEKKVLLEKQRALQAQADKGKDERKAARKVQAQARKDVRDQKSEVRDLSANIYSTFSTGTAEEVNTLADELMEASTTLVETVRSFGVAAEEIEGL